MMPTREPVSIEDIKRAVADLFVDGPADGEEVLPLTIEPRWENPKRRLTRSMVDTPAAEAGLVRIVPTQRLVSRQRREDADPRKMAGVAAVFAPGGKIPPLSVARQDDGTYLVLDGNHRLFWAQNVGLDRLPVIPTTPAKEGLADEKRR